MTEGEHKSEIIDIGEIPPGWRARQRDPLKIAILVLPHGKAIKREFPSHTAALKKRRSLLTNLDCIHTSVREENGRAYLYIWKKAQGDD